MTSPDPTNTSGTAAPGVVALADLAAELIAELPQHRAGRAARTVLSGDALRVVVIALAAGAGLAEHDAPPAATLQCLSGRVTVRSGEDRLLVSAGELVPVPRARHSVEAHADSAILLTVLHG